MKGVAILSPKGGVGKTSLGHLLALGSAWRNIPAYFFHTDMREPMTVKDRPYGYLDVRNDVDLENVVGKLEDKEGLIIIDGGGNRSDFDEWISEYVDLVIIPITANTESVEQGQLLMQHLNNKGIDHVRFLINMESTNPMSKKFDNDHYFSKIDPNLIMGGIKRVEAVKQLQIPDEESFQTPPSHVNNLSRTMFDIVVEALMKIDA